MFLNMVEFKKFLKNAYKGSGLIVGVLDHNLVLMNASSAWGVQMKEEHVSNELKSVLVKLIGDIPKEGEIYNFQQDGSQTELDLGRFDFQEMWKEAFDFAERTPFILQHSCEEYALMQLHSTMEMRPILRKFVDMISAKDLDHSVEEMPGRPSVRGGVLFWKNAAMIYWAGMYRMSEDMEEIVLPRLNFLDCFKKTLTLREDMFSIGEGEDEE